MVKVIGIVHSFGEYNGRQYDNYNLHCVRDSLPNCSNESGLVTEVIKIKAADFSNYHISLDDNINVYYDRNGRVVDIQVVD